MHTRSNDARKKRDHGHSDMMPRAMEMADVDGSNERNVKGRAKGNFFVQIT